MAKPPRGPNHADIAPEPGFDPPRNWSFHHDHETPAQGLHQAK
jgi:hypothetical protein